MTVFLEELVGLKSTAPFHVPEADYKVLMGAVFLGGAGSLRRISVSGSFADPLAPEGVVPGELEGGESGGMPVS